MPLVFISDRDRDFKSDGRLIIASPRLWLANHSEGAWSRSHDPFLGQLFDIVDLIKPVSNVRAVHTCVRPSIDNIFFDFNEI